MIFVVLSTCFVDITRATEYNSIKTGENEAENRKIILDENLNNINQDISIEWSRNGGEIKLQWTKVPDLNSFSILRKVSTEKGYSEITSKLEGNTYIDKDIKEHEEYYYKIKLFDNRSMAHLLKEFYVPAPKHIVESMDGNQDNKNFSFKDSQGILKELNTLDINSLGINKSNRDVNKGIDEDEIDVEVIDDSNNITEDKDEESNNVNKNQFNIHNDDLSIAYAGLIANTLSSLDKDSISDYFNKIPKGKGIWVAEKDREYVLGKINSVTDKTYFIDEIGYLRERVEIPINKEKSNIYSSIIDKVIKNQKVIIGKDIGVTTYNGEEKKYLKSEFKDENSKIINSKDKSKKLIILNSKYFTKSTSLIKEKEKENELFNLFQTLSNSINNNLDPVEDKINSKETTTGSNPREKATESKVEGKTTEVNIVDKSAESKVEVKTTESKTVDKATESKVEGKATESKIVDSSTESKVEGKTTEIKTVDKSAESKVEVKTTESKTIDKATESKVEGKATEGKIVDKSTESKVEEKTTESKAEEESAENSIEEKTIGSKVESKPIENKIEEQTSENNIGTNIETKETSSIKPTTGRSRVARSISAKSGWVMENNKWQYYHSNGSKAKGWTKIYWNNGNRWYYFNDDGMASGWQFLDWDGKKNWYYFDGDGLIYGWHSLDWNGKKNWYFFNGEGLVSGWQYLEWDGKKNWFYFDGTGLVYGWQHLERNGKKNWYFFEGFGAFYGWHHLERDGKKNWYYFDDNGMATNRIVDGYIINSEGIRNELPLRMSLEIPKGGTEVTHHTTYVGGWALNPSGVKEVGIYVDDKFIGKANIGGERADVNKTFPGYKGGDKSGFGYTLDTKNMSAGQHKISAKAVGNDGTTLEHTTNITIKKLPLKMYVENPKEGLEITQNKDVKTISIGGWALNPSGVKSVDIYVDSKLIGKANIGGQRLDIDKTFPGYLDGSKSGFGYTLDLTKIAPGEHKILARAIGNDGTTLDDLRTIKINKLKPLMDIEAPVNGSKINNATLIHGWALNASGINRVEIHVDGNLVGNAHINEAKLHVDKKFPGYLDGDKSGFSYMLNTDNISQGTHKIVAKAFGNDGTMISEERTFERLPKSTEMNLKVETYGLFGGRMMWTGFQQDGAYGPIGSPIQAIKLSLNNPLKNMSIKYQVYIKENKDWQTWKSNGEQAGEIGKTIQAIRVKLDGVDHEYSIKYTSFTEKESYKEVRNGEISGNLVDGAHSIVGFVPILSKNNIDINKDTIWKKQDGIKSIDGILEIKENATLTIEPGVEILFNNKEGIESGIVISGKLIANGEDGNKIKITSYNNSKILVNISGKLEGKNIIIETNGINDDNIINNYGYLNLNKVDIINKGKKSSTAISTKSANEVKISESKFTNFNTGVDKKNSGKLILDKSKFLNNTNGISIEIAENNKNKDDILIDNNFMEGNDYGIKIFNRDHSDVNRLQNVTISNNHISLSKISGININSKFISKIYINNNEIVKTNLDKKSSESAEVGAISISSTIKENKEDIFANINPIDPKKINKLSGNNYDAIVLNNLSIDGNATIEKGSYDYIIRNGLKVNKNLKIGKGVIIRGINSKYPLFEVRGQLLLNGSGTEKIILTSVNDNSYPMKYIDNNDDNEKKTSYIYIDNKGVLTGNNVLLKNFSKRNNDLASSILNNGNLTLSNSTMENSEGIRILPDGVFNINRFFVKNSSFGIYNEGKGSIFDSSIMGGKIGVYNSGSLLMNKNIIDGSETGVSVVSNKETNILENQFLNCDVGINVSKGNVNIVNNKIMNYKISGIDFNSSDDYKIVSNSFINDQNSTNRGTYIAIDTNGTGGLWQNNVGIKKNTKYTLEFKGWKQENIKFISFMIEYTDNNGNKFTNQTINLNVDNTDEKHTFTTLNDDRIVNGHVGFYIIGKERTDRNVLVYLDKVSLKEEGTKDGLPKRDLIQNGSLQENYKHWWTWGDVNVYNKYKSDVGGYISIDTDGTGGLWQNKVGIKKNTNYTLELKGWKETNIKSISFVIEYLDKSGKVTLKDPSSGLNIRSGSSTSTSIVGNLNHGAVVQILGSENGWYKISHNGKTGYVREDFIVMVEGNKFINQTIPIRLDNTNEKHTFLSLNDDRIADANVGFYVGGKETTYMNVVAYLEGVSLKEENSVDLIKNGSFKNDRQSWWMWGDVKGYRSGIYAIKNNSSKNITAQYNYWGSKYGPNQLGKPDDSRKGVYVAEKVDYSNYLAESNYVNLPINLNEYQKQISDYINETDYAIKRQFGGDGIDIPTGNYSKKVTDWLGISPVSNIEIYRTYNSRSKDIGTYLGKGWRLSYESSIKDIDPSFKIPGKVVTLPDGGVQSFKLNSDNTFTALDSRNTFEKINNQYILTAKTNNKFIFNDNALIEIRDKNNNSLKIIYNQDKKISKIHNENGVEYDFSYSDGKLVSITENINGLKERNIVYNYSNNLLKSVKDLNGNITETYDYDSEGRLNAINKNGQLIETITYYDDAANKGKIKTHTDELGSNSEYTYDNSNRIVTITDSNKRFKEVYYNNSMNVVVNVNPDGTSEYIEYVLDENGINALGEIKSIIDKNRNTTSYEYDKKGNVVKQINPEGGVKENFYDDKNNLIKEIDESGKKTFYIYDENKINIIKIVKPINGTDEYNNFDDHNFLIERFEYYSPEELKAMGCNFKGLLKRKISPEGGVKEISYDRFGNIKKVIDEEKKVVDIKYNNFGHKIEEVVGNKFKTQYEYDKKGNLLSTTYSNGSKSKIIYDIYGRKVKEISPDLYDKFKETKGKTYIYYNNDKVKSITNEEGYITEFTYDIYGNIKSSKLSNGSYNIFEYDEMGRVIRKYVKYNDNSEPVLLEEYSYYVEYEYNKSSKTKVIKTIYSQPNQYSVTEHIYDFRDSIVEEIDEDGVRTKHYYNLNGTKAYKVNEDQSITYYEYDGINRIIKVLTPVKEENNELLYIYERFYYDRDGNKIKEVQGKELVKKVQEPTNLISTEYSYYKNGKLKAKYNEEGRRTEFYYDEANNLSKEITLKTKYDKSNNLNQKELLKNGSLQKNYESWWVHGKVSTYDKVKSNNGAYVSINDKGEGGLWQSKVGIKGDTNYVLEFKGLKESNIDKTNFIIAYIDGKGDRILRQEIPVEFDNTRKIYYFKTLNDNRIENAHIGFNFTGKEKTDKNILAYLENISLKEKNLNDENTSSISDKDEKIVLEYENNYLGKPVKSIEYFKAGDIYGNNINDNKLIKVITEYTYDNNGNLVKEVKDKKKETNYQYDNLNRETSVRKTLIDKDNNSKVIETKKVYDWNGSVTTSIDGNGNSTSAVYDSRGFLKSKTNANGEVKGYYYDLQGRLFEETANNNPDSRIRYIYDNKGNVVAELNVIYVNGEESTSTVKKAYKYDKKGNKIKELDAIGFAHGSGESLYEKINSGYGREYEYDLNNQLIRVLDPEDKSKNLKYTYIYEYDGLGKKIKETNSKNHVFTFEYNNLGDLISKKAMLNNKLVEIEKYKYDLLGNVISKFDGNGNETKIEINSLNKPGKITFPGDNTISVNTIVYQYDIYGDEVFNQDSLGKTHKYILDSDGRILKEIELDSNGKNEISKEFKYDNNGNKVYEKDGNGNVTEYMYDSLNRIKTVKFYDNSIPSKPVIKTKTYEYDKYGNLIKEINYMGNITSYKYDNLGRLIEKYDGGGNLVEKLEYYNNDSQSKSIDAEGNVKTFNYDKNNRLVSTTDGEGNKSITGYDSLGNIDYKTDGNGNRNTYQYDELNRLKATLNPKKELTIYNYDNNGNLIEQIEGNGNKTTFSYNVANKKTKILESFSGKEDGKNNIGEEFTYYPNGNIKTRKDRNGKITNFTYDIHGRLISETVDKLSITFGYDNNGNQVSMKDATGTTLREFDGLNRVVSKVVPVVGKSTYVYDEKLENGHYMETTIDPKGNVTKKVYNKADRLIKVIADGKTVTYEYYNNGNRKYIIYPDGSKEEYEYNKNNALKKLTNKKANGEVLETFNYTHDKSGNIISKTDKKGLTKYNYDELNRILKVTEPSGKEVGYTYDKSGNRLSETTTEKGAKTVTIYSYNERNRLISTVTKSGEVVLGFKNYDYDNNGNIIKETTATALKDTTSTSISNDSSKFNITTTEYTYDELNNQTEAKEGNRVLVKNTYNGDGLRVSKENKEGKSHFLYEGDKIILELDDKTSLEKGKNVYGLNLLMRKDKGNLVYYMYNGHGDVTNLINEKGEIVGSYYYDAFGKVLESKEDIKNPYKYAGYEYDEETGKYYLKSRMYDPESARFMQEDTYRGNGADPLSLNLYTYCVNNPLIYDDQNGHWPSLIDKGISWIRNEASYVGSVIKNEASYVGSVIKNEVSYLGSVIKNEYNYVKKVLNNNNDYRYIKNVVKNEYNYVKNNYNYGKKVAKAVAKYEYNSRKDTVVKKWNNAKKVADTLKVGATEVASGVVDFAKNINVPKLVFGGVSSILGVGAMQAGLLSMAVPMIGIPVFLAGTATLIYGSSEVHESMTGVNQMKSFFTDNIGISEDAYYFGGDMLTAVSSFGIGAAMMVARPYVKTSTVGVGESKSLNGNSSKQIKTQKNFNRTLNQRDIKTSEGEGKAPLIMNLQLFGEKGVDEAKYQVGAYQDIKGVEGLDAHHAGQKAVMKKLVDGYDEMTAPAINVPRIGHTKRHPVRGIVSRSTKGITDARQLLARDIMELRRVYPDIPNSKLQELIDMNKKLYKEMRK